MDFINLVIIKFSNFFVDNEILKLIVNNRFFLILLVIVLLKMKYATYSSMWLSALINIPGTILHETMHFLVGLLLNAKPTSYDLIPHKSPDGDYIMGSVSFRNLNSYNAFPSSLAPLLLLPIGYMFNSWYFQNINISFFNYLGYILLQTIIIENAVPSSQDFKVGFSYPLGLLFYITLGVLFIIAY